MQADGSAGRAFGPPSGGDKPLPYSTENKAEEVERALLRGKWGNSPTPPGRRALSGAGLAAFARAWKMCQHGRVGGGEGADCEAGEERPTEAY